MATDENLPKATDGTGMFRLNVLAAAAELELEKIRDNVKRAEEYARHRGLRLDPAQLRRQGDRSTVEQRLQIVPSAGQSPRASNLPRYATVLMPRSAGCAYGSCQQSPVRIVLSTHAPWLSLQKHPDSRSQSDASDK